VSGELIIDSFAGGGGASLGISWALGRGPDIAINHDAEAITLHAANHPETRHYREDVWKVDPVEATGGQPVGLMWLSPDCKHFSKAKGGKPVSRRVRGLAWVAVRWAEAVRPRVLVLENVEEFQTWGPVLVETGRPCPDRKGKTFRAFIAKLRRLGYVVEWKELRACDYGTPTIRRRLFIVARCDGQPITWPAATHGKGRAKPWRTAAECIDWDLPCPSIFGRPRPLAPNTLKRIAAGLRRFVLESPRPFVVNMAHGGKLESVDAPLSTIATEKGGCRAVVVPYIAGGGGRAGQSPERSVAQPYQTITAKGDAALVAPVLVPRYGERPSLWRCEHCGHTYGSSDLPVCGCVKCGSEADLIPVAGQLPRAASVEQPMATVVPTQNGGSLVSAFLAKHYGGNGTPGASLFDPVPTVTTVDHNALVAAHLEVMHGTGQGRAADAPAPAVLAQGQHLAEVRAFLVAYYGNERDGGDLFDPMRTVTSKERFGLVTIAGQDYAIVDIGMRMLAPRELYRAQGFPDSYRIDVPFNGKPMTKTAQVRMCGNSVVPQIACALVRANYAQPMEVPRAA
jgi:DNA (cytosine-5)-methyltransferase 1